MERKVSAVVFTSELAIPDTGTISALNNEGYYLGKMLGDKYILYADLDENGDRALTGKMNKLITDENDKPVWVLEIDERRFMCLKTGKTYTLKFHTTWHLSE